MGGTYSGQAIINQINNLPFDYNSMNLLSDTDYLTYAYLKLGSQ